MLRNSVYCFIILFFCIGCKKDNVVEILNDKGEIVEKYTLDSDSLKVGEYQKFYGQDLIQESAFYKAGKLDGPRKLYYKNSNIEIEEFYHLDTLIGDYKNYHQNGNLLFHSQFNKGVLEGIAKKYFDSGELQEEISFENNEENGPFKEFYLNGQVQWEGHYLNGDNEFGLLKQYSEAGELIKKMMCDSLAICQTIWTKEKGDITPPTIKISKSNQTIE